MPSTAAISWAASTPAARLDLRDQQLLAVREREGRREAVRHCVGVVDADAAGSTGVEAREFDEAAGIVGGFHLRNHHTQRAEIERGRHELPLGPWDTDEWRDARAAHRGEQLAHRLHAQPVCSMSNMTKSAPPASAGARRRWSRTRST